MLSVCAATAAILLSSPCVAQVSQGNNPPLQSAAVQSPYDAFVCFNKSFADCLLGVQGGVVNRLVRPTDQRIRRTPPKLSDLNFGSPEDGTTKTPAPRPGAPAIPGIVCKMGSIAYAPTLDPNARSTVVFASPILLQQLGELGVRVHQARINCSRLIETFEQEMDKVVVQDALSLRQSVIGLYKDEIAYENTKTNQKVGGRVPKSGEEVAELKPFFVNAAGKALKPEENVFVDALGNRTDINKAVADAFINSGQPTAKISNDNFKASLKLAARLREMAKNQMITDFRRRFDDANEIIDERLRELARSLMILDRSAPNVSNDPTMRSDYEDGAWVKQGTVVWSRWTR
jgi:hypothetical protein